MFGKDYPGFLLFSIITLEEISLSISKYFKPPSINASSINICEKKQKQQQKIEGKTEQKE